MKCVIDTKELGLKIEPTGDGLIWKMIVHSDSDWAGDKDDRKSVGGFMTFLNDVLICW